jgi:phosphoglycerol transferase MdoB-like AlkP superfamily enzyme
MKNILNPSLKRLVSKGFSELVIYLLRFLLFGVILFIISLLLDMLQMNNWPKTLLLILCAFWLAVKIGICSKPSNN